MSAAGKVPNCDHHWVSKHQPDFPPPIYWVGVCSLCGQIDAQMLADQIAALPPSPGAETPEGDGAAIYAETVAMLSAPPAARAAAAEPPTPGEAREVGASFFDAFWRGYNHELHGDRMRRRFAEFRATDHPGLCREGHRLRFTSPVAYAGPCCCGADGSGEEPDCRPCCPTDGDAAPGQGVEVSAANGGPPLVPVSDNAETREALRRALERHFGSFLAHDPHNPEVFWERGVDAVLAALPPVAGPEVRPDETLRATFYDCPNPCPNRVVHERTCLAAPAPAPGDEELRARIEALFSGGPDTVCRTVWIKADDYPDSPPVECVQLPLDDLRTALASPAPAATEVGEG